MRKWMTRAALAAVECPGASVTGAGTATAAPAANLSPAAVKRYLKRGTLPMPDPSLIVGREGRRRRLRRVERAAVVELQAIASHLDAPLDVRTREVHIWVDACESTQAWLRAAGAKREEASRRLLEYPSTPALAGWLSDLGWGRGAVRSAPTGRGTLELPGFHTQGDTLDEAIATSKKH